MKTPFTFLLIASVAFFKGQTITYATFSSALTQTETINLVSNASFNAALTAITGSNVTWDASALVVQPGTPVVHLSYNSTAAAPNGSLYPASNYTQYDPALTTMIGCNYFFFSADSVCRIGSYEPNGAHEIFQNPDKQMIFPFSYGQSFSDTYQKTNYSDATTVSSNQSGSRTVSFNGFGTLILPQGAFSNVALISEMRTNSLGPNSYYYSWYSVSDGRRLLYRSENGSSITTAMTADLVTGLAREERAVSAGLFPNPISHEGILKISSESPVREGVLVIYNGLGGEIRSFPVSGSETRILREGLSSGLYLYTVKGNGKTLVTGKLIIQ